MLIELTKLNGNKFWLNPKYIIEMYISKEELIDVTIIKKFCGNSYDLESVKQTPQEINQLIKEAKLYDKTR